MLLLTQTACNKSIDERLVGKWKVLNVKIKCTNPDLDSLNSCKNGNCVSGSEALKLWEKSIIDDSVEYEFKSDYKFAEYRRGQNWSVSNEYQVKDSGLIISLNFLDVNTVMDYYTIDFISDKQVKLTNEVDHNENDRTKRHTHTNEYMFQKEE